MCLHNVHYSVTWTCRSTINFLWEELCCSLQKQLFLLLPWHLGFLPGETSASQQQKFHTDDVNLCLHNYSRSYGVLHANLFHFMFLLVNFGKALCSSANKLQQNSNASSREEYIPRIFSVLLQIHRIYILPLWTFVFCLSFVNNS